jgi:putative (di)nucleoside polyphosphate hydrolase
MRFLGNDEEINLHTKHAEFNSWKWSSINELVPLVVDFKKPVYREIVKKFGYLANGTGI